jgi:hypothetical protein
MNRLLSAVLATMGEGIIVNSNMDIVLYNDAAMRIVNLPVVTSASHLRVNEAEAASATSAVSFNFSSIHLKLEEGRLALAQTDQGRIVGTVRDQNNAVIPGATIVIKNKRTGEDRSIDATE